MVTVVYAWHTGTHTPIGCSRNHANGGGVTRLQKRFSSPRVGTHFRSIAFTPLHHAANFVNGFTNFVQVHFQFINSCSMSRKQTRLYLLLITYLQRNSSHNIPWNFFARIDPAQPTLPRRRPCSEHATSETKRQRHDLYKTFATSDDGVADWRARLMNAKTL